MISSFFNSPIVGVISGILGIIISSLCIFFITRNISQRNRLQNLQNYRNRFGIDEYDYEPLIARRERLMIDEEKDEYKRYIYGKYHRLIDSPPSLNRDTELFHLNKIIKGKLRGGTIPQRIDEIVDEKKNKFLSIPSISFHYANKEQINSFYNDYFKEPTVANLVQEISGEIIGELKGSLPQILETKVGSKNLTKWISTAKLPDISLNGMFLRYQRETIKSGQVQLGLEEVEIELSELQAFDDAISDFQKRFEFQIDDQSLEKQHANLKAKAAERTLIKLEQATGFVLIEGKFTIEIEGGEFYKCTLLHPVNEYLSGQLGSITISVSIPIGSIETHTSGNYRQSIGKSIPMRIYGEIWQPINRKSSIFDLQLTPLAIY